jgi:hypothetical protein
VRCESRDDVTEAPGQLGNPKEGECLPLEPVLEDWCRDSRPRRISACCSELENVNWR